MSNTKQTSFKKYLKMLLFLSFVTLAVTLLAWGASAAGLTMPDVRIGIGPGGNGTTDQNSTFQILGMLTILSLAPSILIMLTGFTRIIIVLSFLRNALGTQQVPPNQVLIGLALFLTLFVMTPVLNDINKKAYEPFSKGQITQEQFIERATVPIHQFMRAQTRKDDVSLFLKLSGTKPPKTESQLPMYVLMPAFAISELKTAFQMAFAIFLPFLVVDMVVSSTLMSMGMMMLPPAMIALPFKLLLFVLVNGWDLTVRSLILSFR